MTPSHSSPPNEKWPHRPDRKKKQYVDAIAVGIEFVALASGALCLLLTRQAALAWIRYACGALAGTLALHLLVGALQHRVGRKPFTLADALTRGRFATGTMLVALAIAGFRARVTLAGGIAWGIALLAATLLDWLDGPIARRVGPTRLGGALDIEADSWLTLSTAVAVVVFGGLPWWVLAPPLLRYIHPVRAWLAGDVPAGGGPWWARVTGVAQMALLLAALAPAEGDARDTILSGAAYPIVGAQLLALLALLSRMPPAVPRPQSDSDVVALLHDEKQ